MELQHEKCLAQDAPPNNNQNLATKTITLKLSPLCYVFDLFFSH